MRSVTPLGNKVFLKLQAPKYKPEVTVTGIVDLQNKPLFTERDNRAYLPQYGEIGYVPAKINGWDYEVPLRPGDLVYHHHFAFSPEFEISIDGVQMYWQDYEQIYAVERDGDIIPLERYVLIEPLFEKEDEIKSTSGIFVKAAVGKKHITGTIRYASLLAKRMGLNVGDVVRYFKRSEYPLKMRSGEILWKTRVDNLIYIQ